MADGNPLTAQPYKVWNREDALAAAFAEIDASLARVRRPMTSYSGPLDGLADSIAEANAYRLRHEDR